MKKYLNIILGSLIIALTYNIFFLPNNLISTSVFGLSEIFYNAFPINPGITILSVNLILLFFGLLTIGYGKCKSYALTSFLIPIFIYISFYFTNKIDVSTIDNIVLVIAGSYLTGIGYSLIHKESYHVGGFTILDEVVNNYRTKKNKELSVLVDLIIIIITSLLYGFETAVYSTIVISLIRYMSTKSKVGISSSKTFFIITTKEKEVKDYLINELSHDYTEFNVKGGYSNNKNKIIMTVIDTKDYYRLKEGVNLIDENAFVFIIDNYEAINKNVTISKKLNNIKEDI